MTARRLPLVLVLLALGACVSAARRAGAELEPAEGLSRARALLESGQADEAAELLLGLQGKKRLSTPDRHAIEVLLERASFAWIERLVTTNAAPGRLVDLYEEELPPRARVSAGVAAASRYLALGLPLEAYLMVKRVDEKFRTHYERAAAGNAVAQAGFDLARSERRYLFFFTYRDRALEALEYLVLNYPSNASCEEAYLTLARMYEEDGELPLALERLEDLVLFFPQSAFAAYAEARIPELRLAQVRGARYDRSQAERARNELADWLKRHPQGAERAQVLRSLARAQRLLCENDLVVARFYRRVDEPFGVRLHAGKALELAREIPDDELAARATELLAEVAGATEPAPPGGALP